MDDKEMKQSGSRRVRKLFARLKATPEKPHRIRLAAISFRRSILSVRKPYGKLIETDIPKGIETRSPDSNMDRLSSFMKTGMSAMCMMAKTWIKA